MKRQGSTLDKFFFKIAKRNDADVASVPIDAENGSKRAIETESETSPPARDIQRASASAPAPTPAHSSAPLPEQKLSSRTLRFQPKWQEKYSWIKPVPGIGVLCRVCSSVYGREGAGIDSTKEDSFVESGFCNWKNALEKFHSHDLSKAHTFAVDQERRKQREVPVEAQVSAQVKKAQKLANRCLFVIVLTALFLARQGLAFRGHTNDEGNFQRFLISVGSFDQEFKHWLERKKSWTSWAIQNEIINIIADEIIENIKKDVKGRPFSVIVDGTQDLSGCDQHSVCIRYVNDDLDPVEDFVGLFTLTDTSGESVAQLVLEVLKLLDLPLELLRGQTYDGAANMSGKYRGAQARILRLQPLAKFIHCLGHTSNLAAKDVSQDCDEVARATECGHEVAVLLKKSSKFRSIFGAVGEDPASEEGDIDADDVAAQEGMTEGISSARISTSGNRGIKPLCPTRWLARLPLLVASFEHYGRILLGLEKWSTSKAAKKQKSKEKAKSLYRAFSSSKLAIGLAMGIEVFSVLENLNQALQGVRQTVTGAMDAAVTSIRAPQSKFCDTTFDSLYSKVLTLQAQEDLKPLHRPRHRQAPRRWIEEFDDDSDKDGDAEDVEPEEETLWLREWIESAQAPDVVEPDEDEDETKAYFKDQFHHLLRNAIKALKSRFLTPGMDHFKQMEQVLLTGEITAIIEQYKEINIDRLRIQLPMFQAETTCACLKDAVEALRQMSPEVRRLFSEVERLVVLLLVIPASSCEAERSFSALRRLKTYLRTTMKQLRLSALMLSHVHQQRLDKLDVKMIMSRFIKKNTFRETVFGR